MVNKYDNIELITSSKDIFINKEFELILINKENDGRLTILKYKEDYIANIKYYKTNFELNNNLFVLGNLIDTINNEEIEIIIELKNKNIMKKKFKIIYQEIIGNYIHFYKKDGEYFYDDFRWEVWTYDDKESKVEYFINYTDVGVAQFIKEENFIIRKNTRYNEWKEQTYTFSNKGNNKNLYLVYGVNKLLTSLGEVIDLINPKIEVALMDELNKINAFLSDLPIIDTKFYLYLNDKLIKDVKYNIVKPMKLIEFYDINIDFSGKDLIEIRASATYKPVKVKFRNILNDFYYDGNLGIAFMDSKVKFSIFSITAFKVELLVYSDYNEKHISEYSMEEVSENVYEIILNKIDIYKKYYLYRMYFREINIDGLLEIKTKLVIDPYANVVSLNGEKGYILNLDDDNLKPINWNGYKLEKTNKPIIYETHIRDFTIDLYKIPKNIRGKYLGFVYDDFNEDYGIKNLIDLGVTHIQLMPIFDFASVDERKSNFDRNWGYDPKNYNAIEGSYSINPYNPSLRVKELREMINKIHENNIKIIMDVVYNHIADTINFENISQMYYFRTDYRGRYTNGSGCGNELATERPMVKKFIIDSIKHWIYDFNIDGFRFDLMELIDLETMKDIVKSAKDINPNIIIYGEPWKGGNSEVKGTYKGAQRSNGFGVFNDTFRDYIRGDNSPSKGFINGSAHDKEIAWNIIEGLKGSVNILTDNTNESINYIDAHDNFTIWDQIVKSLNYNIKDLNYRNINENNILNNEFVRRNILALSIILTAQGIPFIHSGSEMLRTKYGDHNSYRSNDFTNSIKWQDKKRYKEFYDYIKGLIKIRNEFDVFTLKNKNEVIENLDISFLKEDDKSGVIKLYFRNYKKLKNINDFLIIYNGSSIDDYLIKPQEIPKSKGESWKVIADNKEAGLKVLKEIKKEEEFKIKAFSIMIMYS